MKITDPKTGKVITFHWDKSRKPTSNEIKQIIDRETLLKDIDPGAGDRVEKVLPDPRRITSIRENPRTEQGNVTKLGKSQGRPVEQALDALFEDVPEIVQGKEDVINKIDPNRAGGSIDNPDSVGARAFLAETLDQLLPTSIGGVAAEVAGGAGTKPFTLTKGAAKSAAKREARQSWFENLTDADTSLFESVDDIGKIDREAGNLADETGSLNLQPWQKQARRDQIKRVVDEDELDPSLADEIEKRLGGEKSIADVIDELKAEGFDTSPKPRDFDLDLTKKPMAKKGVAKLDPEAGVMRRGMGKLPYKMRPEFKRMNPEEVNATLEKFKNSPDIDPKDLKDLEEAAGSQNKWFREKYGSDNAKWPVRGVKPERQTVIPGAAPGRRVRVTAGGNVVHGRQVVGTTEGASFGNYINDAGEEVPLPISDSPRAREVSPRDVGSSDRQRVAAAHEIQEGPREASTFENIFGLPKSIKSTIDLPALRQALIPSVLHPGSSLPALKNALRSIKESNYDTIIQELANRPRAGQYENFGLAVSDPGTRQQFPSGWAEKIPGIRSIVNPSERMYNSFLSTIRANEFDRLAEIMEQGASARGGLRAKDYQGVSNLVNDMTGHGKLPGEIDEKLGGALNVAMYSPKFQMSLLSRMNPKNYLKSGKYGPVAGEFRKDMGKFAGGTASLLGAGEALIPDNTEIDPRSSSFGFQFGNVHGPDLMGGYKPIANLTSRLATGERKTAGGDIQELDEKGGRLLGSAQLLEDFGRSKLAPGLSSMGGDVLFGRDRNTGTVKNVIGEDVSLPYANLPESFDIPNVPERWIASQFTPMFPEESYEALEDLGPAALPIVGAGFLGAGSNTYDPEENPYRTTKKSSSPSSSGGGGIFF